MSNELVKQDENLISGSQNQKYYSLIPKNQEETKYIYNAVNNPDFRIADFINKTITIKHLLIETVELENEENPEIKEIVPRTVIIDPDGASYVAVSYGVFNSMKRIVNMFGEPHTWQEPLKIEIKQINKDNKSILTVKVV